MGRTTYRKTQLKPDNYCFVADFDLDLVVYIMSLKTQISLLLPMPNGPLRANGTLAKSLNPRARISCNAKDMKRCLSSVYAVTTFVSAIILGPSRWMTNIQNWLFSAQRCKCHYRQLCPKQFYVARPFVGLLRWSLQCVVEGLPGLISAHCEKNRRRSGEHTRQGRMMRQRHSVAGK